MSVSEKCRTCCCPSKFKLTHYCAR